MRRMMKFVFVVIVLGTVLTMFSADLVYFAVWWHEKAGHIKKAVEGYEGFIKRHPDSRWIEEARERLKALRAEAKRVADEELRRRRAER